MREDTRTLLLRHLYPVSDESLKELPAGATHYALRRMVDGPAVDFWQVGERSQVAAKAREGRTVELGPPYPIDNGRETPMDSYERPAYLFWRGYASELTRLGWSKDRVRDHLRSKEVGWVLDARETEVEDLGRKLARFREAIGEARAQRK